MFRSARRARTLRGDTQGRRGVSGGWMDLSSGVCRAALGCEPPPGHLLSTHRAQRKMRMGGTLFREWRSTGEVLFMKSWETGPRPPGKMGWWCRRGITESPGPHVPPRGRRQGKLSVKPGIRAALQLSARRGGGRGKKGRGPQRTDGLTGRESEEGLRRGESSPGPGAHFWRHGIPPGPEKCRRWK